MQPGIGALDQVRVLSSTAIVIIQDPRGGGKRPRAASWLDFFYDMKK
jgi:hypothetical protein